MSWGYNFIGWKKAVAKAVREAKAYGDASQFDSARTLVLAEIDAYPEEAGIFVEASGHHDSSGNRNLAIKIGRASLVKDE